MSSPPIEGGRPLLRGRLFGFPVHLDLSFVIIMGVLGYSSGLGNVRDLVLWLVITPIAVLTHELGHAFVARTTGARPQIALAGFGGVTTYTPPAPLSRARSLAISLAGPGVGLVLGGLLLLVARTVPVDYGSWQDLALQIGIFTCLGWSLLNLLPILPLDGGQAMRELIPGDAIVRERRAAYVSIVVAALAAVAAFSLHQTFLALFLAFFGVSNVMTVRSLTAGSSGRASGQMSGQTSGQGAAPGQATSPDQAVIDQLWLGHPQQAREVLAARSEHAQVDAAIHGAVLALTGDRDQGHAVLEQELTRRPDDVAPVALLGLTFALEHDWDGFIALLQSPRGVLLPNPVVERAADEARGTGREDVAGRLTYLTRPQS